LINRAIATAILAIACLSPMPALAKSKPTVSATTFQLNPARIDRMLQQMVAKERVAGAEVLIWKGGREVYYRSAGYADREAKRPMSRDTLIQVFSMTKPVTGVGLMRLWEQGRFGLDDELAKYLPEYRNLQVYAGTDSAGRLTISPSTGTGFTIAEDGVHDFGFKLAGGATTIQGASVSTPAGSPPSVDVALTTQAAEGDTFRLTLNLPDGTTDDIVLTAKPVADDPSEFQIGATVADTVTNLRGAIVSALANRAQTTLAAASSVVAGKTFFAAGPQTPVDRVDFTPPATAATATGLRPSTANDTVIWYTGDNAPSVAPRDSATAQIDSGMSVNFGVRANEEGIAKAVRSFAILAAEVYPSGDLTAADRNFALSDRVRTALAPDSSVGSITAITTELSGSQRAAKAADSRLATSINSAQDLVDGVEKADDQEVAASLLGIPTRLQASYQTTAMLSKLSLVNFID